MVVRIILCLCRDEIGVTGTSQTPAQVQCQILSGANAGTVFFLSSFCLSFPRFGVAPRVGDTDSHALAWPLELGMRRFCAFFLGNCSKGRFPLQNLSMASMVPKPKPVCAET